MMLFQKCFCVLFSDQVDLYIDSVSILSLSGFDVNLQISGVVSS